MLTEYKRKVSTDSMRCEIGRVEMVSDKEGNRRHIENMSRFPDAVQKSFRPAYLAVNESVLTCRFGLVGQGL